MNDMIMWLMLAYVAGSVATYLLVLKSKTVDAVGHTIDKLIEEGYLRSKRDANGEIEILKWNARDD